MNHIQRTQRLLMRDYLNKPYLRSSKEGWCCFSMSYDYGIRLGLDLPTEYKGHTLESYDELYKNNPEEAVNLMLEFIDIYYPKVNDKIKYGDLVSMKLKNLKLYPYASLGIYAGRGNLLTAILDKNITMASLKNYKIINHYRIKG